MRLLWRAACALARDAGLRDRIRNAAAVTPLNLPPPEINKFESLQPTPAALVAIRTEFRALVPPLHLSVYDLAEVNRWMYLDKTPPTTGEITAGLQQYAVEAQLAANTNATFEEAAGMLLMDERARNSVGSGSTFNLQQNGFSVSASEELRLKQASAPGGAGDIAAKRFYTSAWSDGSTCLVLFDIYPEGFRHSGR